MSERLKKANVTLIPTLTLFGHDSNFNSILNEVKALFGCPRPDHVGTNIGYLTNYRALTKEYDYLARAGLTFPQILASPTTSPAARLGFASVPGQVKAGMDGPCVLEDDPGRDVHAFSDVALTIRKGQVIYRRP